MFAATTSDGLCGSMTGSHAGELIIWYIKKLVCESSVQISNNNCTSLLNDKSNDLKGCPCSVPLKVACAKLKTALDDYHIRSNKNSSTLLHESERNAVRGFYTCSEFHHRLLATDLAISAVVMRRIMLQEEDNLNNKAILDTITVYFRYLHLSNDKNPGEVANLYKICRELLFDQLLLILPDILPNSQYITTTPEDKSHPCCDTRHYNKDTEYTRCCRHTAPYKKYQCEFLNKHTVNGVIKKWNHLLTDNDYHVVEGYNNRDIKIFATQYTEHWKVLTKYDNKINVSLQHNVTDKYSINYLCLDVLYVGIKNPVNTELVVRDLVIDNINSTYKYNNSNSVHVMKEYYNNSEFVKKVNTTSQFIIQFNNDTNVTVVCKVYCHNTL